MYVSARPAPPCGAKRPAVTFRRSAPGCWTDDVNRLPGKMGLDGLDRRGDDPLQRFRTVVGVVRTDDDVGSLQQIRYGGQQSLPPLLGGCFPPFPSRSSVSSPSSTSRPRPPSRPLVQRRARRRQIDQVTPSGVDQHGAGPHPGDGRRINQVVRLMGIGRVQGDHIGTLGSTSSSGTHGMVSSNSWRSTGRAQCCRSSALRKRSPVPSADRQVRLYVAGEHRHAEGAS